ncbi:hypothetical protein Bca52824_095871, partial [Brassica carinata]
NFRQKLKISGRRFCSDIHQFPVSTKPTIKFIPANRNRLYRRLTLQTGNEVYGTRVSA